MEFTESFYNTFSNIAVLSALGILALYLLRYKKDRIADFFVAVALSVSTSEGLKFFFNIPRPAGALSVEGGSFPSTHTTVAYTAFFFYMVVCHKLTWGEKLSFKGIRKPTEAVYFLGLFITSLLAGILRYLATAHYLIDVLAGIILGLIISLVFAYYDIAIRRAK